MRRYKAMKDEKLVREAAICPENDLPIAIAALDERGLKHPTRTAISSPQTPHIKPMLAKPVKKVPTGARYVMEPKLDGHRGIVYLDENKATLRSRPGAEITSIPYILNSLKHLPRGTILDGEIVDLSGEGRSRVQSLSKRHKTHIPTAQSPALNYVIFDILAYYGSSVMNKSLADRKDLLDNLLIDGRICKVIEGRTSTNQNLQHFLDEGYEGAVVKAWDSVYTPNGRSEWVKLKPDMEIDALCTGTYLAAAGSKYDGRAVGGITYTFQGYEGQCAGKMNDKLREDLYKNPDNYIGRVVEIGHWGIQPTGALLHPSFRRFRDSDDKKADEL